jgi:hypothetical protein
MRRRLRARREVFLMWQKKIEFMELDMSCEDSLLKDFCRLLFLETNKKERTFELDALIKTERQFLELMIKNGGNLEEFLKQCTYENEHFDDLAWKQIKDKI